MNGEIGSGQMVEDVDNDVSANDEDEDLALLADDDDIGDNVGDLSVEINVEELVAKIESKDGDDVERRRGIRRRLEELRDQREAEKELDNTFNFNFDEDY
jgi:hypothetical protein